MKMTLKELLWAAVGDVGAIRDRLASPGGMSPAELETLKYRARRADERVRTAIELLTEVERR